MDIENIDTEWKESWTSKNLKTVAAFHNTGGGRMIIGRRDNGEYIGVPDIKQEIKVVADSIRDKLHIVSNTRAVVIDNKDCIVIDVPKGDKIVDYEGRFYMRVGNTTQMIESDELKKILLEENGMQWLDRPCNIKKEELSKEAISFFIRSGQSYGRISDYANEDDIDKIISSYGLEHDGKLTLAAGVLFSPEPRRLNDAAFLKIGFFDETNVLRREDYVEGPIIMSVDKTLDILYDRYIPDTYGYDGPTAQRTIVHQYPREALRELIVNAMVHKDYSIQEPTTIRVYSDKLEIFCFGGLPRGWSTEKLLESHPSIRRNRTLATVFFAAGYVENWGQGIEKVMEQCHSNGNPDPEFSIMCDGLKVTVREKIKEKPQVAPMSVLIIDEKSEAILKCIAEDQSVTATEIARIMGVSRVTVQRRLTAMVDAGILRRDGSTKKGIWIMMRP